MFTFTRYVCPACKTKNKPSLKYCRKCGQWLLDTIHEPRQVKYRPLRAVGRIAKTIVYGVISIILLGVLIVLVMSP